MAEAHWYVVHTYSGYENKVKANIDKTIENRHLEDQILEVRVPMQEVVELKNGAKKSVSKKMFPGYVLINMVMNDDTWYVVRNTRGVTGFVGPGSKPVPLTDMEMRPLGIKTENIEVDFAEGDTVVVTGGVWKDTIGVIQAMNPGKQSVTINVELFGRETPVEISFADVKLQIPAGKATPAPPVGPALGQHGVNIVEFTKQFNARTADQGDLIIPVVITVYADRSFSFVTKTPPAPVLIKKACNIKSGSSTPNKDKVATLSKAKLQEIAELKMPDLNAASLEAAMSMIAGTARSMGVIVGGSSPDTTTRRFIFMKRGKKYQDAVKSFDKANQYDVAEAISLVKKNATAKFDETIELHIKTGCDGRHAEQQIRGAVVLPHGTGKTVKVLVFAKGVKLDEAQAAGADYVGGEELVPKIQNEGWLDFDVIVATPDMMGVVGRLGRVLGPKGLMPNPKAGTVTMDVTKAINDIKAGKIEYRLDKTNIIHVPVGKASFTEEQLSDNFQTLMGAINKAKPSSLKGQYVKSATLTSTMGPGVKLNVTKITN